MFTSDFSAATFRLTSLKMNGFHREGGGVKSGGWGVGFLMLVGKNNDSFSVSSLKFIILPKNIITVKKK